MNVVNTYVQPDSNGRAIDGLLNTNWSATATHATAATATKAAVANTVHVITDIIASSDKAGSIAYIKQNTTVLAQVQIGAGLVNHKFGSPIVLAANTTANCAIDGTSLCDANMMGYSLTLAS